MGRTFNTYIFFWLFFNLLKHRLVRLRLHEQIKPPLIAQILDPYEVTQDEFAQIKRVLFAHVNAPLTMGRTFQYMHIFSGHFLT